MSNEKNAIRIGEVQMEYDNEGKLERAFFTPAVTNLSSIAGQVSTLLKDTNGKQDKEQLKKNAELTFGAWFNQMNEIELADREKYEIVSEIKYCDEYSDGSVKSCIILFTFREREVKEVESDFSAN